MLRTYKYRIYPTPDQVQQIERTFGCCRLVYNLALEVKIRAYRGFGMSLSAYDLMKQLTEMKADYDWLCEVDSQSLNQAILNMDSAYKKFFAGGGFPKFKSKSGHASFQAPGNKREVDFESGTLTIPKLAKIPIRLSRKFSGKIKTVTISRTPTGKYFASILVDTGVKEPEKCEINLEKAICIDLGLKHFAILSDGKKINNPRFFREGQIRLKVLNRRVSRKKKGSKNQKKARLKVALQYEKISNKRKDFQQKLSTELVSDSQVTTFCMEDLAVKNMSRRCKPKFGENNNPLHNGQAAKSGLNKSIRDAGWSEFVRMMEYKCAWKGKNLLKIGRFEPSSKTCNNCGNVNEILSLKDRDWTCAGCGEMHDRDVNAAKNICDIAIKKYGEVRRVSLWSRGQKSGRRSKKILKSTSNACKSVLLPIGKNQRSPRSTRLYL